jgi:hypothetical protein
MEGVLQGTAAISFVLTAANLCIKPNLVYWLVIKQIPLVLIRHCEPTGPAQRSRSDNKLREAIQLNAGDSGLICRPAGSSQ